MIFKHCTGCGYELSLAEWEDLPLLGYQVTPPWKDDPGEVLEMRNHDCRSTITILLDFTAAELEAVVAEIQRADPSLTLKLARSLAVVRLKSQRR